MARGRQAHPPMGELLALSTYHMIACLIRATSASCSALRATGGALQSGAHLPSMLNT